MIEVTIDKNSGYCFGVEYAIQMAEDELNESGVLYCLGDIVHNDQEVKRLHQKGLRIISREELKTLKNSKVLIRAHGEPPETYQIAIENQLILIDASCPVVLKLQNRVKNAYDQLLKKGQIVIYGKEGHAEVIGLVGQTEGKAIVITEEKDLDKIDFEKPVTLFSQTTKSTQGFYQIKELIQQKINACKSENMPLFEVNDSICRQVSNREPQMKLFAAQNDVIIFVSGKKSSNGKSLFAVCLSVNPNSYFVESEEEIQVEWFSEDSKVGICGATSTPLWQMENAAKFIESLNLKVAV